MCIVYIGEHESLSAGFVISFQHPNLKPQPFWYARTYTMYVYMRCFLFFFDFDWKHSIHDVIHRL